MEGDGGEMEGAVEMWIFVSVGFPYIRSFCICRRRGWNRYGDMKEGLEQIQQNYSQRVVF